MLFFVLFSYSFKNKFGNFILYAGMQKLTQFSEGVRESLRRLSSVTWMAEELLKVADYYMPNKWVS